MAKWIVLLLLCLGAKDEVFGSDGPGTAADNHLEVYKNLFALKRKEQVQVAEQLWSVTEYAKQYKAITFFMETIFPVLNEALLEAARMNYTAGDPFPEEQEQREVIGKIYENVAFFGDVLLRMPDITKQIYKKNKAWHSVLGDSIQFCNMTKALFSGPHATQLHLVAQEMGLLPEEDGYVNPFRASKPHEDAVKKPPTAKRANKKPKKKGPRLRGSKTRHEL